MPPEWVQEGVHAQIVELLPDWEIVQESPEGGPPPEAGGRGESSDGTPPSSSDDALARAEVIIGVLRNRELDRCRNLRWLQTWGAGIDNLLAGDKRPAAGVTVTNMSGIHGTPMAEHTFALLLALGRGIHHAVRAEPGRSWMESRARDLFELRDKHLLVVGMGHIGGEIARIGRGFGMSVHGITRSGGGAEREQTPVSGSDELHNCLGEAHAVVVAAPLTAETRHLFGEQAFAAMKPGAVFVNMGRGPIVEEAALIEALRTGRIAAAGLDVFETEPLPSDSPLWDMENVIITAHYGGVSPRYTERAWSVALENIRRYASGEPLTNQVDPAAGY
jgi:phosphoglycerate dehydrogenase-like enzyme